MNSKPQAIAYLRVSGKSQVDGDGFPRQEEAVKRYAKSNGLELLELFRDEGVSGTKELADRAGLAACLDRVESNGVRIVLVERADRLARDWVVGEVILNQFRALGVKVIEADHGADLTAGDDNPTGKLIRQILGAVSEFEKNVIVLKLRAARNRVRRTDGRCEGRKPYGTRPGEEKAIEKILELRRAVRGKERMSFQRIAETLNAEGITTRQGGPWKPGTVYKLVKDHRPGLTTRERE